MNQIFEFKETKNKIKNASDLFGNIKKINLDYSRENVLLFCLDARNKLISKEVLFMGGLDCCTLDPKVIFRTALKKNAHGLIIAHNHPSGNLEPSKEDENITGILKDFGKMIGLRVLDSIIFNKKEFYSIPVGGD